MYIKIQNENSDQYEKRKNSSKTPGNKKSEKLRFNNNNNYDEKKNLEMEKKS